jgi:hypothetical protein
MLPEELLLHICSYVGSIRDLGSFRASIKSYALTDYFKSRVNWNNLNYRDMPNWVIDSNVFRVDWVKVSREFNLNEEYINKWRLFIDWNHVAKTYILPDMMIRENESRLDWDIVLRHQTEMSTTYAHICYLNHWRHLPIETVLTYQRFADPIIKDLCRTNWRMCYVRWLDDKYLTILLELLDKPILKKDKLAIIKNVSKNQNMSESFIIDNINKLDIIVLLTNRKFSMQFIRDHIIYRVSNLYDLLRSQELDEQFLNDYKDEIANNGLYREFVTRWQTIPPDLLEKFYDRNLIRKMAKYQKLKKEFIINHKSELEWNRTILDNTDLFDDELLIACGDVIDWQKYRKMYVAKKLPMSKRILDSCSSEIISQCGINEYNKLKNKYKS